MANRIAFLFLLLISFICSPHMATYTSAQEIDYEALVGDDMREVVVDSVLLTMALTTKNGMSGGSFEFSDQETDDDMKLTVTRYPYTHEFNSFSNDWYMPFVALSFGTFEFATPIILGTVPDDMGFSAWTIACGGGVRIPLNESLRFSPSLNVLYSRIENSLTYNDPESASLRPYFDGIIANWEVGTLTYGPSLLVDATLPYHSTIFTLSSEWTYLHSETIEEDHAIQKADAHTTQWRNRIAADIPLGVSVKDMPLSLGLDVSRTDLDGKGESFSGVYLYEVGGQISFNPSSHWSRISELYVGAGYTFEDDMSGWTFRAGFDF